MNDVSPEYIPAANPAFNLDKCVRVSCHTHPTICLKICNRGENPFIDGITRHRL